MKMVLYCSTHLFDSVPGLFTIKHHKMRLVSFTVSVCLSILPHATTVEMLKPFFIRFFAGVIDRHLSIVQCQVELENSNIVHSVKPCMCSYVKPEYNFPSNFQNVK
jgi:hypothetical protein